jgi:hypothetical protein
MFRLIVWIVVGVLALSFFGISLENLLHSPTTESNFQFLFTILEDGWGTLTDWVAGIGDSVRNMF